MKVVQVVVGLALVVFVLRDVFLTIIVARPTARTRWRISIFLLRLGWPAWRRAALRRGHGWVRHAFMSVFGPLTLVTMLVLWLFFLVLGFGLALHGVKDQVSPVPGLGSAMYLAATSMLTVGFGDIVGTGGFARALTLLAAASGLAVVTMLISLLFTLVGAFQDREEVVVVLSTRAGRPASGVALLETYGDQGMLERLPGAFEHWEAWIARIRETHLAYPLLFWFLSSEANESWVASVGAVMDASALVTAGVEGPSRGPATMTLTTGMRLIEDMHRQVAGHAHPRHTAPDLTREDFAQAWRRLEAAGLPLRDEEEAWSAFALLREAYVEPFSIMCAYWDITADPWMAPVPAPAAAA
ncbi:MAG TPA: ion channel [Miltoncostaeaceae bacterium]|nr:ion channel [Miltoncostaeaceae bacterium]